MGGPLKRLHQSVLIGSTLLGSWLGMQAVHECGHVLGAFATGGQVERVVLNPLTISRTDLAENPAPLVVVWAGPTFGILFPLALWGAAALMQSPGAFVLRFFAGFCLIGNGAYLAFGSFAEVGDCGEMLRHGSPMWQLWLFGIVAIPSGFFLWHRQGTEFGLGIENGDVNVGVAYTTFLVAAILLFVGFLAGGA
ncbi:MAG: hypothetical protein HYR84_13550 [Planctomycetes bacterium]|nr:hypothetical protein [Planctomycetota bacterium]